MATATSTTQSTPEPAVSSPAPSATRPFKTNNPPDQVRQPTIANIKATRAHDPNNAFDTVKFYNLTTFDTMADLTFGDSLDMLQASQCTTWRQKTFTSICILALFTLWHEFPLLNRLFKALEPAFRPPGALDRAGQPLAAAGRAGRPTYGYLEPSACAAGGTGPLGGGDALERGDIHASWEGDGGDAAERAGVLYATEPRENEEVGR